MRIAWVSNHLRFFLSRTTAAKKPVFALRKWAKHKSTEKALRKWAEQKIGNNKLLLCAARQLIAMLFRNIDS